MCLAQIIHTDTGLADSAADCIRKFSVQQRLLERKISIEDAQSASEAIEELMGDRVEARREYIIRNALDMEDLDI